MKNNNLITILIFILLACSARAQDSTTTYINTNYACTLRADRPILFKIEEVILASNEIDLKIEVFDFGDQSDFIQKYGQDSLRTLSEAEGMVLKVNSVYLVGTGNFKNLKLKKDLTIGAKQYSLPKDLKVLDEMFKGYWSDQKVLNGYYMGDQLTELKIIMKK